MSSVGTKMVSKGVWGERLRKKKKKKKKKKKNCGTVGVLTKNPIVTPHVRVSRELGNVEGPGNKGSLCEVHPEVEHCDRVKQG